jgi:predicted Zn finger-like uncharacterized protein
MLIVCPNCATSYDVEVASLRPHGRQVRCARCRVIWQAKLPHTESLIAAARELAPARRTMEAVAEASGTAPPAEPPVQHFGSASDTLPEEPEDAAAIPPAEASDRADAEPAEPDFFAEVESPPVAPVDLDASPAEDEQSEAAYPDAAEDIESIAAADEDVEAVAARRFARPAKRKRLAWPLSHLQSAILALIISDAIVVGWRTDFVRAMPQTASFYAAIGMPVNLRGLNFDRLVTATEQDEGVPILVVGGDVVNDTSRTTDVPHIRFAVRNAARQEIYSWTAVPSRLTLPAGEAVSFHTRLASPPPDAHDITVRFVSRYDILTSAR